MKKKPQKSPAELRILFSEADKRLHTVELELEGIVSLMEKIQDIEHNLGKLNGFYHSNIWTEGRERILAMFPDDHFNSAGEDSIWNITQKWYSLRLRLNKILADSLYNELSDDLIQS